MKQKLYNLLSFADMVLVFVCAVGLISCSEEEPSMFTTERIVINCTDSVTDASILPGSRTRSVSESTKISSSVLTSKSGKKLYLSCTEASWPVEKTAQTRGAKVTTATIGTIGISASVYPVANSYTSAGCGSYFYKESVSSGTPTSYYWPTAGYKISFFAYYPYNNAAFTVQSAANVTGAPTYAYTVPSVISNQLDIMTGQVTDQLGGSASPVNMSLIHRCSAVHFNITNDRSDAITVNSISIEGVKYTGTLNENTWTLGSGVNSSSTNPFTLTCNTSVVAGATTDITGTSNIFLMLPQALPSGAKLKVVVNDEEFETDLSGTWVAGKEYTYTITMNELGPIDLSMVDNAGTARVSMTTANCYLVHSAGGYRLPLVYGNAIMNDTVHTLAFYPGKDGSITNGTDRFVNHNGDGITGPWITKSGSGIDDGMGLTVVSAELLWQDTMGLISEVGIDGDYLTFTVGTFNPGNALIAVKDGSGTVLWSWHIWATSETLATTTTVATGSHNYAVAHVNLGWVATEVTGKQGYCPYYQWGRKDPLIPASSYKNSTNHTVYNISNTSVTGITYQRSRTATIADNIKNPTCFFYNDNNGNTIKTTYYNMWDAQNAITSGNVTTATRKTVYDPCPPGFCVPTGNLWYYFCAGNQRTMSTWNNSYTGATWNTNITGEALWFPICGLRHEDTGSIQTGSSGNYWSASSNSYYGACVSVQKTAWRYFINQHYRARGLSIRPVAEE